MPQKPFGFGLKYDTKLGAVEFSHFMIKNCWFLIRISKNPEMNCDFHDLNSAAYVLFRVHEENVAMKK